MRPPLHVTVWDGPGGRTPAILVHGTLSWATRTFEQQRPLAGDRRLILPDRRGFGGSPDLDDGDVTSDYAVDAEDLQRLMAGGAHLVGHSYGGTVAMLAAAARPDLVRSLALIEPCAHTLAADRPVVAEYIEEARGFMAEARRGGPERYVEERTPGMLRAARTALHERPCWLADLATEPLRASGFPKLVILGGWDEGLGKVMRAVGTAVADRIGARLVRVPGATHEAQREQPAIVNELLTRLWAG